MAQSQAMIAGHAQANRTAEVLRPLSVAPHAGQRGPAPTITKPDLERIRAVVPKALRPYKVVVLDCDCHSFDDVEVALCRIIPGMTRPKAHQHAWEIHTTGASVVARAPKERAELYQQQLAARGLRVTIEPD